jgi:hypothetical protein
MSEIIPLAIIKKTELYEDEDIKGNFEKIVLYGSIWFQQSIQKLHNNKKYCSLQIVKCKGFNSKWTWTFESLEHQKTFLCKTWSIMVEKSDYIYAFNMIDSEQACESEVQTFEDFVNTIKIS